jgi:hypothetical protein
MRTFGRRHVLAASLKGSAGHALSRSEKSNRVGLRVHIEDSVDDETAVVESAVTARLHVSCPGYVPQMQSILLNDSRYLGSKLNCKVEQILAWSIYELIRRNLPDVHLTFSGFASRWH